MENLSPEQVEYWADNEKDMPKKQSEDRKKIDTSTPESASQDNAGDDDVYKDNVEKQRTLRRKPNFNARYYSKFGEYLHDPPEWNPINARRGRSSQGEAEKDSIHEVKREEPDQIQMRPAYERTYCRDRDKAAQESHIAHAETKEKVSHWNDVVDDPGEWDMCQ